MKSASKLRSHIQHNLVAYVALFVALSGSAYAVNGPLAGRNTVGSADIINNEVRSTDLRTDGVQSSDVLDETLSGQDVGAGSITGADIEESSLGTVPSAANAADADLLGGIGPSGYQQFCANGAVKRIIHVNGDAPDFPSSYTSNPTYLPFTFSCRRDSPGVVVRRSAVGTYQFITVFGDLTRFGFVNVDPSSNGGSAADNFANVRFVGGIGEFEVIVRDADGGTEDADFTVLLP